MSDQIYITPQTVKDAADKLLYKGMFLNPYHPLLSLLLVDWTCAAPDYPKTPISQSIALAEILTRIICDDYYHHRQVEGLTIPDLTMSKANVIDCINDDIRTNNMVLIQCGWLYHRYVRVDLQLNLADIGKIDGRTLRRHIRQGMQRLTTRLIQEEKHLRKEHHKQRLYVQLPGTKQQNLIGRDHLVKQITQLISQSPKTIQIIGSSGVGKHSLILAILQRLIDDESIDHLIWLDEPASSSHVLTTLRTNCLPNNSQLALQEFFSYYCTVVVLNKAYALDDLQQLLSMLSGAIVLLVGNEAYSVRTDHLVIVPELIEADAKQLIQYVVNTRWNGKAWQLSPEEVNRIYNQTGGNPGAILAEIEMYWKDIL